MISLFDNQQRDGTWPRLSVTWNGIEFNSPTVTRDDSTGHRLDSAGFSTPSNFHSEAISDITKNGGGVEVYNPLTGTRVMNMRGSIRADTMRELSELVHAMQKAFSPLYLQSTLAANRAGTLTWPPPGGLPSWVRDYPLKFTRLRDRDTAPTRYATGKFLLQYHVMPLALPDPVSMTVLSGVGVNYEAEFLVLDGGRSFDQTEDTVSGDGDVTWLWGTAPVWPTYEFTISGGAGPSNLTITTTQGHMADSIVLDVSSQTSGDFVVDTRDMTIARNGVVSDTYYSSGNWPILRGNGDTTIAWTNTTNITSNLVRYRESDFF
jgi:hypothetical protein